VRSTCVFAVKESWIETQRHQGVARSAKKFLFIALHSPKPAPQKNPYISLQTLTMNIQDTSLNVNVLNLDASIAFYSSIGLNLANRWGNHYAQMTAPGISIGLHPTSGEQLKGSSGNLSIGFTTDNWEATKVELLSLNIACTERNEEGGQFLHFADPDGNALYFIQPKR
jgi:catechol 2,3-dioxygenase-like lactoylglutathione lyase family enzyme